MLAWPAARKPTPEKWTAGIESKRAASPREADRLPEARYGFGLGANFISPTGCSSQIVAACTHFLPRGLGSATWGASTKTLPGAFTQGGCCMTDPQRDG